MFIHHCRETHGKGTPVLLVDTTRRDEYKLSRMLMDSVRSIHKPLKDDKHMESEDGLKRLFLIG